MNDQYHLEQVSRSFAVSIQSLAEPLKDYVGLAYLLCRVVDTIEDSSWPNPFMQKKAFDQFESFLLHKPTPAEFKNFCDQFPEGICREEQELIQDSYQLFERYHVLPAEIRACIQNPVLSMSRGMKFFIFRDFKQLKLKSLKEVDQYCFFVAGVVGELLTNLASRISMKRESDAQKKPSFSLVEAYHFALFLQKVNILKDRESDERNGRFLIPEARSVWLQLENHSQHAFNYIEKIPNHLNDFKLFCSWALFLGLNSLSDLIASYSVSSHEQIATTGKRKMSREQAKDLFAQLKNMIAGEVCLKSMYQSLKDDFLARMSAVIPPVLNKSLHNETSAIELENRVSPVLELYSGQLNRNDLAELNVLM